jgi:hypothetical protein
MLAIGWFKSMATMSVVCKVANIDREIIIIIIDDVVCEVAN